MFYIQELVVALKFFLFRHQCEVRLNKCSLFSTLREHSVNRKDLQALTLVGPPRDNPEQDPLAILHLENRLYP